MLGRELEWLLNVFSVLDCDGVLLIEVAGGFLPDVEFVGSGGEIGNLEIPFLIGDGRVGMIEDHPVSDHPGMDIATDLGRELFRECQWLDGDACSILGSNDEVVLPILDGIGMRVVGGIVIRNNEHGLVGPHEQNVRHETASLLVEGHLRNGALFEGGKYLRWLFREIDNDVGDPFGFRVDDKLFIGNILGCADSGVFRLLISLNDQRVDLGDLSIQKNLALERSPLGAG